VSSRIGAKITGQDEEKMHLKPMMLAAMLGFATFVVLESLATTPLGIIGGIAVGAMILYGCRERQ